MSVGTDAIGNVDGAAHILRNLRERFAPDAIDSVFQAMLRFTYSGRADLTMGAYLMKFDMLRRKAEARMVTGSGFPDEFVSVL